MATVATETWPAVLEQQRSNKLAHYGRSIINPDNVILHQLLGEGASGSVYYATFAPSGMPVAVKVMNRKQFENPVTARRLKRECQIMEQLEHPHIVRMYGSVKTESHQCVVMQLAENGDLLERLRRHGAMSENEARRLFIQLVSAIGYMHSKGFVHRDIKPENLFLDAQDNLLLGDFGFANTWSLNHYQTDFCGSLHYAAPEVIGHKLVQGPEADVWSCGAVLLALATARLPFEGNDHAQLVRHVKTGRFIKSSKVTSADMLDLLSKMLEPNQQKRYTLKDVMQHRWVRAGMMSQMMNVQQEQLQQDFASDPMTLQQQQQQSTVRFNVPVNEECEQGDSSDEEQSGSSSASPMAEKKDSSDAMDVSPKVATRKQHLQKQQKQQQAETKPSRQPRRLLFHREW